MRYYVTSDIHGFFDEFISALTKTGYFQDKSPKKLIVCGDLFDRGKKPKELQNFILDLLDKDELILIKGNHEDFAQEFVENYKKYCTSASMPMPGSPRKPAIITLIQLIGK